MNVGKNDEKQSKSTRVVLNDQTYKKIALIANTEGFFGKQAEITSSVLEKAINHYYKEVTLKELENLSNS